MRRKPVLWAGLAFCLVLAGATQVRADTVLWYNGDADGVSSFFNDVNGVNGPQVLYNQFNATGNWVIDRVWSNNIFTNGPPALTTASWQIYTNVSTTTGDLVASGDGLATLTPTGFVVSGLPEYKVEVSGLNVALAPGSYWLAVWPDNTNGGDAANDTTSGANGVGTPTGSAGNTYASFSNPAGPPFFGPQGFGTSAGVAGSLAPVPELGGRGQQAVLAMAALVVGLAIGVRPMVRRRVPVPVRRS
jgi:hypothetical protein